MHNHIDLANILFLDIECVSVTKHYDDMPEDLQHCWDTKSTNLQRGATELLPSAQMFSDKGAIYAEFGKIICISVGIFRKDKDGVWNLRLKSFYGHDEKVLLEEFSVMLKMHFHDIKRHYICGHNIKEFDIPYICRRMMIHGMPLPNLLDLSGKKPWETTFLLDTMEMWSFGDRKAFTGLKTLCAVFGIPSPKDDIDGSEVGRVYWEEDNVERIELYCKKDVLATAQVFLRLRLEPILREDQVTMV